MESGSYSKIHCIQNVCVPLGKDVNFIKMPNIAIQE